LREEGEHSGGLCHRRGGVSTDEQREREGKRRKEKTHSTRAEHLSRFASGHHSIVDLVELLLVLSVDAASSEECAEELGDDVKGSFANRETLEDDEGDGCG
jgi:hypothetical protein